MPVILRSLQAALHCESEFIGKLDPYIVFLLESQKIKSKICKKGGKNPKWEEQIQFQNFGSILLIQVWDSEFFRSDGIIGVGSLNLLQFVPRNRNDSSITIESIEVDLVKDGDIVGALHMEVEIVGDVVSEIEQFQEKMGYVIRREGKWGAKEELYF